MAKSTPAPRKRWQREIQACHGSGKAPSAWARERGLSRDALDVERLVVYVWSEVAVLHEDGNRRPYSCPVLQRPRETSDARFGNRFVSGAGPYLKDGTV